MNSMKKLTLGLASLFAMGSIVLLPTTAAYAQLSPNQQAVCEGLGSGADCADGDDPTVDSALVTVINVLSIVVGVIAVIIIIIAGVRFITAQGDPQSINTARNTIIYALVGLVIVSLAQIIVRFVLSRASTAGVPAP